MIRLERTEENKLVFKILGQYNAYILKSYFKHQWEG